MSDSTPPADGSGDRSAGLDAEARYVDGLYARLDRLREETAAQLREVRRGTAGGTHQARTERDAMARIFEDRLAQLRDVDDALAFGRLESTDGELRYIGRIGLRDEDLQPLLLDWRAPQSSAFYQATAATPLGVRVRRHLTTRGRTLTAVDDEVFDPGDIPEGAVLTGETALLAALDQQRTGRMGDIVSTIQAEQDRIIRSDGRGVLVVQGGPGTGKTAVALHRAAFLLYAHKERLARSGVLLVGPSRSFLRYIEQVLPSLGETGVVLRTVGQLFPGVDADGDDTAPVRDLKGRAGMADLLRRAVHSRQRVPAEPADVEVNGERIRVEPALVERAIRRAQQRRKPHNVARTTFVTEALHDITDLVADAIERRGHTLDDDDRRLLREDVRTTDAVRSLLNAAWLPMSAQKLVADLYARPTWLAELTPTWTAAERALLARPRSAPFTVSDVALLDEAAELLGDADAPSDAQHAERAAQRDRDVENARQAIENMGVEGLVSAEDVAASFGDGGRAGGGTAERAASDRSWTYGHIVVDEAQELTPMQWRALRRRSPLRSFTIVGDLAQSAALHPAANWQRALRSLTDDFRIEHLTVNYRTPRLIAELAEQRASRLGLPIIPSRSVREGGWPVFHHDPFDEGSLRAVTGAAVQAVRDDRDLDATGTVGVVAPTYLVSAVHSALAAALDEPVGLEDGRAARITVLGPGTAKGLEFDTAVVVAPRRIADEAGGRGGLYVAMTRPTQRLRLVGD